MKRSSRQPHDTSAFAQVASIGICLLLLAWFGWEAFSLHRKASALAEMTPQSLPRSILERRNNPPVELADEGPTIGDGDAGKRVIDDTDSNIDSFFFICDVD